MTAILKGSTVANPVESADAIDGDAGWAERMISFTDSFALEYERRVSELFWDDLSGKQLDETRSSRAPTRHNIHAK